MIFLSLSLLNWKVGVTPLSQDYEDKKQTIKMRFENTEKSPGNSIAHLAAVVTIILGSRVLMLAQMFVSVIKLSRNIHYAAPRTVLTALKHSSAFLLIVPNSRTHQSHFTNDEIRPREAA